MLGDFIYHNPTRLSFGQNAKGKPTDWMVHMLGQAVGAYTNATHGMTLSAVSVPYYRFLMPYALPKFRRFAVEVWGVRPEGKSDEAIAQEGLVQMQAYMEELGLAMDLTALGVTEEMLPGIVAATSIMEGGYKILTPEDILFLLQESMKGAR